MQLFSDKLTIGICAYNEEGNIGQLLHSVLYEQELPAESEVLVVCSGCTDNTVEIVQKYAMEDVRIKPIIEKQRRGKASAVNHILSRAEGDVILFISADTLPNQECFPKLVSRLEDQRVGIVCGKPVPINNTKSLVGKMVQLLWRFQDRVFNEFNDAGLLRHASEVFCIRKGITKQIPAHTVNDDSYLALVAKKKGWRIRYEPEAIVSICGPKSIFDYFRQRRRIIFGHYQVRKLTGKAPQYLIFMTPLHPTNGLKLTLKLFQEGGIRTFSTFILLEFLFNALAMIDAISGKSHVKWGISTTTKKLTYRIDYPPGKKPTELCINK
jgi:cellulose synthase/poly-beta-1,6-N-acetylglucosamine synthase-like glycosyltransferase